MTIIAPGLPDAAMPAGTPLFGNLLRQHRRNGQLTQEELAERAGVSTRAISDLERGERTHPYRETARVLADALGLAGNERITFLDAARRSGTQQARSSPVSPDFAGPVLPRPRTSLIGRQDELVSLVRLVHSERRQMVTITGPAGVGKTRLLFEIGAHLSGAFPDGVAFVDLAPLAHQGQIEGAIAESLGVADQGAIPLLEAIRRRIGPLRLLLLLDNFEHVLAAAPLVSDLLQAAPALQILVTSRALLRLAGEHELPLEPLHTPELGASFDVADVFTCEAVQLFAERATAAQPGFLVTNDNAADVAAICRHLDGLPLAIELAAARIKLLSPCELLARLDRRLSLLTMNRRDAPARQQTLETAIAWSYGLLTGTEQTLLRALAVFADGWSLGAAEFIGRALGLVQPLEALATLVEHNLVVRDDVARSHPRYRMLETIHAFAWDRLTDLGEEARVREAQLQYFMQFARDCAIERLDAQVEMRRSALIAESVNLREVIAWALDHDPDAALALLAELGAFWWVGDLCVTGRNLLTRALDAASHTDSWARGRVLTNAAGLASAAADYPAAAAYAELAQEVATLGDDTRTIAYALLVQANVAVAHADVPTARALHEAALDHFEAIGDAWGELLCVTDMGIAESDWGNLQTAVTCCQRIHEIADRLDLHGSYHAHALLNLADVYRVQGKQEEALAAAREAIALSDGAANRMMVANPRFALARVLLEQAEIHEAAPLLIYYLAYAWEMGDRWSLTPALEASGIALRFAGQWERAAYLLGAADALRTALPFPLGVVEHEPFQQHVVALQSALGPAAFRQAWDVGTAEPLEKIVRAAMDCLASVGQDATA